MLGHHRTQALQSAGGNFSIRVEPEQQLAGSQFSSNGGASGEAAVTGASDNRHVLIIGKRLRGHGLRVVVDNDDFARRSALRSQRTDGDAHTLRVFVSDDDS